MVIWRPSIISSSVAEPFPGWTDSLAAAGAVTLMGGAGIKFFLHGKGSNKFDMVPVDLVSNGLIVASAYCALEELQPPRIHHCTTSNTKTLTMTDFSENNRITFHYLKIDQN